jgi:phosphoserine phosphatase RsbU/P
VLGTVNDVLLDWFGTGRSFVTAAYATVARAGDGWDARVASAGHPPGFLRCADGRVVELGAGGRVLGLTAEHPVGLDRVHLGPGDALVLYTDGITEARDARGVQITETGVADALAAAPVGTGASELADAVVDTALRHTGHTNDDDLAVLVLQVGPDA